MWYGTQSHTNFGGFVTYIKGRTDQPHIFYLNDFSWFTSENYDYFVARMEAKFTAPETGIYKFYMTADDFAVLYIHKCLTCSDYWLAANAFANGCFTCVS